MNEQDLHDNLAYFKVPQAGKDSIRSKLAFKIFDEYTNILKGMYTGGINDTVLGGLLLQSVPYFRILSAAVSLSD